MRYVMPSAARVLPAAHGPHAGSLRWRYRILRHGPCEAGAVAHRELQRAARHQILVREVTLVVGFAVQARRLYVLVVGRVVAGDKGEGLAVVEVYGDAVEYRAADDVVGHACRHGIEPHGREDVEGRHSAAVLVAADAHQVVAEPLMYQRTYAMLRLPRSTGIII